MHKRSDKTLPFSIETHEDIQKIISLNVKEDLHIAFKSWKDFDIHSAKKSEQLTLLCSSFANTIGGHIFFGIDVKRHKAVGLLPGSLSIESKEQLEYFLQSNICPAIENLAIKQIYIDGDLSKTILVIHVPNSDLAPHMAQDKRYYKRSDLKEVIMQEHEVRELYQRSKKAEIDIYAILNTNGIPTLEGGKYQKVNFYPRFLIKNVSSVIEHHYKMELYIPSGLYNPNFSVLQQHFARLEDHYSVFSIANNSPLFQHELATVLDANIIIDADNYKLFAQSDIIIKLYYSNGIKTKYYRLLDIFLYQNKQLRNEDFCDQLSLFE
jgi:hypothetical protein